MVATDVVRVARPAILSEIAPRGHAVIEASAGTGKTYTLEHLVAELVLVHAIPIEQILVVTFTDKATREMRERVRATLRRVLDARQEDAPPPDAPAWTVGPDERRRVEDALAVFDRAPISTIHAFCQRVLTESAFDCARLLQQEQVEAREAFGAAFRDELRVHLAPGARLRPILARLLADVSAARLEDLLFAWYRERADPTPPFDPIAAAAALRRLPTRLELAPSGAVAQALARALQRNPKKEVPALLAKLAPTVERLRAGAPLEEALVDFWAWASGSAPGKKTNLEYVAHYLGRAKDGVGPLADAARTLRETAESPFHVLVSELLPRVTLRLTGRKSERGELDFDDMLTMLADALAAPGSDALVGELRRRYRVALVDEFQDTDPVQWSIFRRVFFSAPTAKESDAHRLVLIGDPKQAIYGFRNADVHTYYAAKEEVVAAGGAVVPLVDQHRSRAPVVDAVNRVLAEGFFTGKNAYPHPVRCARPHLAAKDDRGRDVPAITLFHMVGRPALRAGAVRDALADRIAAEIARLLEGGLVVHGRHEEPTPLAPSDVHVLCRGRTDAESVGAALARARIPFAHYKREGLFQTAAARDVWVVLRAVEDPEARGKRLDAWLTPFFAVPLDRLVACRDVPPDHPLAAPLFEWRALAESQRWAALLGALLERSGLARRELFAGQGERALTDYAHILEVLLEETHRGHRSLAQLLARLGAFIEGRELPVGESGNVHRLESERRAVQVLTMHKSKGLEAEVVFVAGGLGAPTPAKMAPRVYRDGEARRAWVGAPPARVLAAIEEEDREEAERLLYVTLTRARSALYLPYFGPPPPGAEVGGPTSYTLEAVPTEDDDAIAQLALTFEDPGAALDDEPSASENEEPKAEYAMRMPGPYRVVNERLAGLVAANVTEDPTTGFARVEVPVEATAPVEPEVRAGLLGWRAPVANVAEDPHAARYARLRGRRGGFDVTSYTRMKRAVGGYRAPETAEGAEERALVADARDVAAGVEDELPGGTEIGVFLHEVLELLPFESVESLGPDEGGAALLASQEDVFEAARQRNGVAEAHLRQAAELVVEALRATLVLADGRALPGGLASVRRRVAELPFLHPIPERAHPRLDEGPPDPESGVAIERGFIRGVVDLVIEHEGRYDVIDYKSDRLPRYDPDAIARHVELNYLVQARLYTLGTLRALAIHDEATYEARFGGLLYAFLRGMPARGHGVWATRPTWSEVLSWERALHADQPWGYRLPARRALAGV